MVIAIVLLAALSVFQFFKLSELSRELAALKTHLGLAVSPVAAISPLGPEQAVDAASVSPVAQVAAPEPPAESPAEPATVAASISTPSPEPSVFGISLSEHLSALAPAFDKVAEALGSPAKATAERVLSDAISSAQDAVVAHIAEALTPAQEDTTSPVTAEAVLKQVAARAPKAEAPESFTLPPVVAEMAGKLWATLKKNMFATVGVFLVLVGVSFLFSLLIAHGFFPPVARIGAAVALGATLMGAGWKLSSKRPDYAQVLEGGGSGILYLAGYAAMAFYSLISPMVAFAYFFVLSSLVVVLSQRQKAKPLAFVGFAGAYLAPVLTINTTGNLGLVLGYGLLVNAASLGLARLERWLEIACQAFVWTLFIGLELYTGSPSSLPVAEQQVFLAAYSILFAFFPLVYRANFQPDARARIVLHTITAITTPVVCGMEAWIAGDPGLLVVSLLCAAFHAANYYHQRNEVDPVGRQIHATLGVLSLVVAIAAHHSSLYVAVLLASALAVVVYSTFPGVLRALAGLPLALAGLCSVAPETAQATSFSASWQNLGIVATALFAMGSVAVYRKLKADAALIHALGALVLVGAECAYPGVGVIANVGVHVLALTTALATILGLLHHKRKEYSAVVALLGFNLLWLGSSLVLRPTGVIVTAEQLLSFAAVWAVAGYLLSGFPKFVPHRLLTLLTGAAAVFALALEHLPMAATPGNVFMLTSWMALAIASLTFMPRVQKWVDASGAYAEQSQLAAVIVTGVLFLANWVSSTLFGLYPGWKSAQCVWMIATSAFLLKQSKTEERATLVSILGTLLSGYALVLAGHTEALTLVWAVAGLLSVVYGSRRSDRQLWVTGAVISGVVVAKLIGVDMSSASSIARVLSFIGSGLIFVLAGYLAPAPAKTAKP